MPYDINGQPIDEDEGDYSILIAASMFISSMLIIAAICKFLA